MLSGTMNTAMKRKPQIIAAVVSSRWKAAASREWPPTAMSQGTAQSPCSAMNPPTEVAACGA